MLGAKGILSLSHVWRIPSSKALSCKHERLFALISKYSKKRPGLVCPGRKIIFRGTTCIQSLALHFVSTDILCSCNVELTLKSTWHVCPDFWIGLEMRLGSLLEGYFYNSFAEARTDRFLSVLSGVVYSSLSWHLADR